MVCFNMQFRGVFDHMQSSGNKMCIAGKWNIHVHEIKISNEYVRKKACKILRHDKTHVAF